MLCNIVDSILPQPLTPWLLHKQPQCQPQPSPTAIATQATIAPAAAALGAGAALLLLWLSGSYHLAMRLLAKRQHDVTLDSCDAAPH